MDDQQKRVIFALVLCAGVAVGYQVLFFEPPPPVDNPPITEGTGDGTADGSAFAQVDGTGLGTGLGTGQTTAFMGPAGGEIVELLPPQVLLGTDHEARITNSGARMISHLIMAPEQYIPRDDFGGVFPNETRTLLSFGLTLTGVASLAENAPYHFVEDESTPALGANGLPLTDPEGHLAYERLVYRWSDGLWQVDKIFTEDERPYVGGLEVVVTNLDSRPQEVVDARISVWGEHVEQGGISIIGAGPNTTLSACYIDGSLKDEGLDDSHGEFFGPAQWAGMTDRYFLTAVAPEGETTSEACSFDADGTAMAGILHVPGFRLEPGESKTLTFTTFAGPKDSEALDVAGHDFERSVNFGIFSFLALPLRFLLRFFFGLFPNWGVAIILLTIVVKGLMFPWTHKSFKSMEKMREVQPMLKAIQEKYKNDRAKQTEETLKIYKEHNVSPFGCLPMLLQMPIYFALYQTIYNAVELHKADFTLWITDLSLSDPYYVLPVLMCATMMGQQLLMPTATDNPQMKWMMRGLPLLFGLFMLVLPSGLVLYIFISSLLGMIQQYVIRRGSKREKADAEAILEEVAGKQTRQQKRREARRKES